MCNSFCWFGSCCQIFWKVFLWHTFRQTLVQHCEGLDELWELSLHLDRLRSLTSIYLYFRVLFDWFFCLNLRLFLVSTDARIDCVLYCPVRHWVGNQEVIKC